MTDTELMATAALLMARTVEAIGENRLREIRGESPCGDVAYDLQRGIEAELEDRKRKRSPDPVAPSMPKECGDSMFRMRLQGTDVDGVPYPDLDARCDLPRGHTGNHKAMIKRLGRDSTDYIAKLEWERPGGLVE